MQANVELIAPYDAFAAGDVPGRPDDPRSNGMRRRISLCRWQPIYRPVAQGVS